MLYPSKDFLRENYLAHYASPYYDPVKAHDYYMEHRQLKGRKSTAGLNESGKVAAQYAKSQINAERDRKLAERKLRYDSDKQIRKDTYTGDKKYAQEWKKGELNSISEKYKSDKKEETEAKKEAISKSTNEVKSEISKLREELKSMSTAQRKQKSAEYKEKIADLRQHNSDTRKAINEAYKEAVGVLSKDSKSSREDTHKTYEEYSQDLRGEYHTDTTDMRNEYSADKKAIRQDADNKYEGELDKIRDSGEFKKVKKAKSGKSRKSSKKASTKFKGSGNGGKEFIARYRASKSK